MFLKVDFVSREENNASQRPIMICLLINKLDIKGQYYPLIIKTVIALYTDKSSI